MNEPTLFDHSEPTVLAELERKVKELIIDTDNEYSNGHYNAIQDVLNLIAKHKPAEIDKLKQAFAEGGAIPQSAESWVKKFSQGKID